MKYILIIIFALNIWGCQKTEVAEPQPSAGKREKYTVTYFANGNDMYVWYTIENKPFEHYAKKWDTTFTTEGGWTMNFSVLFNEDKAQPTKAGIVLNGDTIDGCIGGQHCLMGLHLF